MPKHIGIAAVSPEGSAVCYRQIHRLAEDYVGETGHPAVTLHNEPFERYLHAAQSDDWQTVGELLLRSVRTVAQAGAEFCITPDNVMQHAVHYAAPLSPIPWLLMTDLVADAVVKDQRKTVGVVGTSKVMFGATYQTTLGLRGVKVIAPEPADAHLIDGMIFNELVHGDVMDDSRREFFEVIARMKARGAEAVIVAFSEAPLLMEDAPPTPVPLYDAVDLLTRTAVRYAVGELNDVKLLRPSSLGA